MGKNQGIRVPAPGEAHNAVITAIRQIISKLGLESVPAFEEIQVGTVTLDNLTANRVVSTDSSKSLASVTDLTAWVAGTTNQITVTDDSDGTVTLSTPQDTDIDADVEFNSVTAVSYNIVCNNNEVVCNQEEVVTL